MSGEREVIGNLKCPVCGTGGAELKLASTKKAYLICDECDVQIFSRSKRSDELLRERATPIVKTETKPSEQKTETRPAADQQPAAKPKPRAVGIFGRSRAA